PDLYLAVDHQRALLDLVHAENPRLRRIEDRRRHQRTVNAAIRNGEGATLHVCKCELSITRSRPEPADFLLDPGKRKLIGIPNHRYDKSLVRPHGHADMAEILVDDVIAIDLGIDLRNLLEGV